MEQISKILKSELTIDNELSFEEKRQAKNKLILESVRAFNGEQGKLNELDGFNCDKCKNKGYIITIAENDGWFEELYRKCSCVETRNMIKKINNSGLKNIIKDYTFDKFVAKNEWQKSIKDKAESFLKDEKNEWFFIGGQSGAGKTHLCTAITASYLKQNVSARYMLWRDDVTAIKAVVNDSEEYHRLVDELKTVPVLYIDDLFKMGKGSQGTPQPPTVADINLAYEIINYRYNNKGLITIISSEYTISEIVNIDEALGGRISERTSIGGYCINLSKDIKKNYRLNGICEI